jgi:hypothetical protein
VRVQQFGAARPVQGGWQRLVVPCES